MQNILGFHAAEWWENLYQNGGSIWIIHPLFVMIMYCAAIIWDEIFPWVTKRYVLKSNI